MKVSELITALGVTPSTDYEGEVKTNNWILAIQTASTQSKPSDYSVVAVHTSALGASIEGTTEDTSYLYEGKMTERTDVVRKFSVSAKRYVGDDFQDWACSHAIKYGIGTAVQAAYVYFDALTGTGEQGKLTINVTSDGAGDANTLSDFAAELASIGTPAEYTYSAS